MEDYDDDGTWRVVVDVDEGRDEGEEAANAGSGRERVEAGQASLEDCGLHIAFEVATQCSAGAL